MAEAKPARRRIVPEQIFSPTKSQAEIESLAATTGPRVELGDLTKHSAIAADLLGPGRKIYVDLAAYQREEKAVDWKELLKERGVKADKRAPAPQPESDLPAPFRAPGPPPRTEAINPLAAVIQRLERAVGMHNVGGEAEDSDDDSVPRIGVISDSEGTEDEGEATDGPKQPPPSAENLADQPLGTAAAGAGPQGGKTSTRREGGNDYDYCDDFIDDTEFIDMLEYTDRRKLKYEGFRIYRGRLDRIDELVKGAQPDKPTRKRKGAVDAPGSDAERLKQGQEGGEEPAAKKQKKKGQGGGQGASAPSPGNGAPSGTPLSPRKPLPPYNMPADVAAAIQELRALAAAAPAPPPPDPLDPKTNRKSLPAPVLDYLKSVQHLFDREFAHHKSVFSRPVLAQLFQFLEPFTSKENLRLYVCGKTTRKPPTSGALSTQDLRALLQKLPPPAPTELGSDDDFVQPSQQASGLPGGGPSEGTSASGSVAGKTEQQKKWKAVPVPTRKSVYEYMKERIGDGSLKGVQGQKTLQETFALFPPGTIEIGDLKTIYSQQRSREQQAAKAAAEAAGQVAGGSGGVNGAAPTPSGTGRGQATAVTPAPVVPRPQPTPPAVQPAPGGGATNAQTPAAAMPAAQSTGLPGSLAAAAAAAGAAAAAAAAAAATAKATTSAAKPPQAVAPDSASAPPQPAETTPQPKEAEQATTTIKPASQLEKSSAPAADVAPSVPRPGPSDDELLSAGLQHGGDEATLRSLLTLANSSGMYLRVVLRLLCMAGPGGMSVAELGSSAVSLGMETWEPNDKNVRNGLSRQTRHPAVAALLQYKYALKCFPGVVDTRPQRTEKGGGKGSAKGGAAGGSASKEVNVPGQGDNEDEDIVILS